LQALLARKPLTWQIETRLLAPAGRIRELPATFQQLPATKQSGAVLAPSEAGGIHPAVLLL
jgi:hypothetical protein